MQGKSGLNENRTSSERARIARWGSVEGSCTRSRPLACVCVGFACIFGRCESRVVTVVTDGGWRVTTYKRAGTPSMDSREGAWRVRGGKGRRVRMYYKQFGIAGADGKKPLSPRPLLPPKSGA